MRWEFNSVFESDKTILTSGSKKRFQVGWEARGLIYVSRFENINKIPH